ncbi:class I SAM-dependent methyltransferase [Phytoactinopolyspora endophytica]|uniref:class I SAM-dependent methyltransferase n=1 Tax=Phytoactinopolyspora endophytica TaxID=1642495 RepID=UPI00101C5182|nr:class I SAM-dependent methyltransferase [Phytoactinopolyspora endophytica]
MTAIDRDADALRLSAESYAAGDPFAWFERLYAEASQGRAIVPWDSRTPHQLLTEWTDREAVDGTGRTATVVGCGLGDDAELVAGLGFDTTAFDVAASAVEGAQQRFPGSPVEYLQADLLNMPSAWQHRFDLVVEIMTVQALPDPPRGDAIPAVSRLVAPGGKLLVIAMARHNRSEPGGPPWPLTRAEVESFAVDGVVAERIEDVRTAERQRWRALFHRAP